MWQILWHEAQKNLNIKEIFGLKGDADGIGFAGPLPAGRQAFINGGPIVKSRHGMPG
jgi:hypothetical protein